jgi:hypothetical protein
MVLTHHNGIKLKINTKRNYTNTWRLNNALWKDKWTIEEIRDEIKMF